MAKQSPTIRDVARVADVSTSTVSLVLNGGNVRETTRVRVQDAIRKLRYTPQSHGRGLRSGRSHTIGFFVLNAPNVDDLSTEAADFWFQLIRGVQATCRQNEYYFSFESLNWRDPDELLRRARGRFNDGAIIVPQYHYHYSFLSDLQSYSFPYVMYNPWVPVGDAHAVFAMDKEAQEEMIGYLIGQGRSSIAFINGPRDHVDAQSRFSGYRDALFAAGITPNEDLVQWSDFTRGGGYESATKLITCFENIPDAIACGNDYMAVGAIHALHDHGLRVPEDVAVTGYGDHDVGRSVVPRLTTMTLPVREIGEALGAKLFAQIAGEPDSTASRFAPALTSGQSA